jgi:diketogulonate reductase-like aldo/keto reductase
MEALQRAGKARFLGVSNVSLGQLDALVKLAQVAPAFVQNRCFARSGWDREVRAFCRRHGIVYQGFSLLTANERELMTPSIQSIAERHGRSLAQIVFRFAMQVGMLPLTGTTSAAHMREDLEAYDFVLSDDEIAAIERVGG